MNSLAVLATFDSETKLLSAVREARRGGLRVRDAYTPYAVHGLDEAMGLPPSRLSWVCAGLGAAGALFMLWFIPWCSSVDWPLNVGGKPWDSLPAYAPVIFESMVLAGGVGTVVAFFVVCRLWPGRREKLVVPNVTDDRFALILELVDSSWDVSDVLALLKRHGALEVHSLAEGADEPGTNGHPAGRSAASEGAGRAASTRRLNLTLAVLLLLTLLAALVLPGSPDRRNWEFLPNMVWSPARDAYAVADTLPQSRRPPDGTIPRDAVLQEFEPNDAGRALAGQLLKNPFTAADAAALQRGRFVFQNYCTFCHGPKGEGGGPVTQRGYPSPPPFATGPSRTMNDGELFHVITYGMRNMPPQRTILDVDDRWKVILYIRQLQKSQAAEQTPQQPPQADKTAGQTTAAGLPQASKTQSSHQPQGSTNE